MSVTKLVAVVSGATAGIGEGIAAHLLGAGATVINVDITTPAANPASSPSSDYHFVQCDLTDAAATRRAAADIAARFQVNVLVNNAGFPTPGMLEEVDDKAFDHGVNLHLRAAVIFMQAFLPSMKAQKFGRVVNMSSRSIHGKKARTVYSGTKAALVAFTRSWALEFGEFGITVNALSPGPVLTELFKKNNPPEVAKKLVENCIVGRGGTPDDVARAAMFFISPDNSYVTGQLLHVCGGASLGGAPW